MKKLTIIEEVSAILAGLHLGMIDGLTMNFKGQKVEYKSGYQVGIIDVLKIERFKIQPLTLDTVKIIMSHLNFHAVGLDEKTYSFGFWYNKENGFLYIDLSRHVNSKKEALRLCKEYNQLAAYDWKNKKDLKA